MLINDLIDQLINKQMLKKNCGFLIGILLVQ